MFFQLESLLEDDRVEIEDLRDLLVAKEDEEEKKKKEFFDLTVKSKV